MLAVLSLKRCKTNCSNVPSKESRAGSARVSVLEVTFLVTLKVFYQFARKAAPMYGFEKKLMATSLLLTNPGAAVTRHRIDANFKSETDDIIAAGVSQ